MKCRGNIISFIPEKGGYGIIDSENVKGIRFEKIECNYDIIRIADYVEFDLYKCSDGYYEALNIFFINNKMNILINKLYVSQSEIECNVVSQTKNGFILDYNNFKIFISSNYTSKEILIGSKIHVYIKSFSEGGLVIASFIKNCNFELHTKYSEVKKECIPLEVNVFEINNFGLIVTYDTDFGFIPNSHISPLKKELISLGDDINAVVIANSLKKGLIFSIRNFEFKNVLDELSESYKNQLSLIGVVKGEIGLIYKINYKGVTLFLNKNCIINDTIVINTEISFKIINFNRDRNISISNLEITDFGLLETFLNNNLFIGIIREINESGFIININDKYNFAFLSFNQISETLPSDFDFKKIKMGSKIKISIMTFNHNALIVSRLEYKRLNIKNNQSLFLAINQKINLKSYEHFSFFGILVKNDKFNGLIKIEEIIPNNIYQSINKLDFIKYCKTIYKRRTILNCFVSEIDQTTKKVYFDLDYSFEDNIKYQEKIVEYFNEDIFLKSIIKEFYIQKIERQLHK